MAAACSTAGKKDEALKVFQLNAERNGDAWPVHVGLARGYAAVGDNQKALEHAKLAAAQAPDALNKRNLEAMVKTLSEGSRSLTKRRSFASSLKNLKRQIAPTVPVGVVTSTVPFVTPARRRADRSRRRLRESGGHRDVYPLAPAALDPKIVIVLPAVAAAGRSFTKGGRPVVTR